ncbi:TonB family protein [Rheinheimera sp.]|uniref:TonB family protein n=1 Tax=Rheinheimera sp. TaxID=1869214 RepID=UPI00307E7B5B
MRYSFLAASLLCSTLVQADLLDALKHYELKDYAKAQAEFSALLPLGNELAAFNLAAMHHNGEGMAADPVKALAYFQLADQLGDNRAAAIVSKLSARLSAGQQQQAATLASQLLTQVQIRELDPKESSKTEFPEAIKRQEPQYPEEAAKRGQFGYVVMRFIVDEEGKVPVAEVLGSYPDKVFDRNSVRALRQWQYAATGKKHQAQVLLTYSLGPVSESKVNKIIKEHKLLDYAIAGSPTHQYALGSLLDLVTTSSYYSIEIDKQLPLNPNQGLPSELYNTKRSLYFKAELPGFAGNAKVSANADGIITKVLSAANQDLAEVSQQLVGKSLGNKATQGNYHLWAEQGKDARVQPVMTLSQLHSPSYWWGMAAKNGNLDAQRRLAAFSGQWENYLLQQNDPQVQTWSGVRQILEGDKAAGQLLLDKAIAQKYQTAAELKAAL